MWYHCLIIKKYFYYTKNCFRVNYVTNSKLIQKVVIFYANKMKIQILSLYTFLITYKGIPQKFLHYFQFIHPSNYAI